MDRQCSSCGGFCKKSGCERENIKQAEKQEPNAKELNEVIINSIRDSSEIVAPPKREWVGLTAKEYEAMAEQHVTNCYFDTLTYAKSIEEKLKEKNYDQR